MTPLTLLEIQEEAFRHVHLTCDEAHTHNWWCYTMNSEADAGWFHALRLTYDIREARTLSHSLTELLNLLG